MARKPAVAGQFYAQGEESLKKQLKECFLSPFGPGKLPGKRNKKMIGAVSPHAGYVYSGPAAAHVYREIGETEIPDAYVILGTSHSGYNTCLSAQDWETPLGIAKVDRELAKAVSKSIPIDEESHSSEHSIEVQVPFLQFVNNGKEFRILPVMVSHDIEYGKVAKIISDAAKSLGKKIIVIASSDFTHYGEAYGYVPFTKNIRQEMERLDMGAVELIMKMDAGGFAKYVERVQATICGALPISALIAMLSREVTKKPGLLKYYTSGDISGDYSASVGYAAIGFY